jgi:hypothetical protein
MKARLYIDVKFGGRATDAESVASALDNVMDVGMAALDDCWGDYGGKPQVGKFLVLDTERAIDCANELDKLMAEKDDAQGRQLVPVRDFLRKVAGKK